MHAKIDKMGQKIDNLGKKIDGGEDCVQNGHETASISARQQAHVYSLKKFLNSNKNIDDDVEKIL